MSGKSNRTRTEELFDHFVDRLIDVVKPGAAGTKPVPDAASLNVVRQFLKENNIQADDDKHEGVKTLKKHSLPFAEDPGEGDL
ncbi:hypothetical protein SAMN02745126_04010 [Enhydrobacter aerosaccus]|uniref:Uncharacterized protein n=1 Tax=Enhydrobacter aerosaccus TaxID=225324 RepID=A0A1T4RPQ5_9HYPH|nr:hypothetical protein [Enhydrobacter aerosaccus]SKA17857.1 hypothetical protein SAMN02745126_04010 [Enhydrobacter aerosaccus]